MGRQMTTRIKCRGACKLANAKKTKKGKAACRLKHHMVKSRRGEGTVENTHNCVSDREASGMTCVRRRTPKPTKKTMKTGEYRPKDPGDQHQYARIGQQRDTAGLMTKLSGKRKITKL